MSDVAAREASRAADQKVTAAEISAEERREIARKLELFSRQEAAEEREQGVEEKGERRDAQHRRAQRHATPRFDTCQARKHVPEDVFKKVKLLYCILDR